MEILQLKYFCDAAVTENFSVTANKFSVPASNISQCIKRLENELRTELFDRTANKIKLNTHGKVFYDYASKSLCLLEEAQEKITADRKSETIRLCIMTNRRIVMEAIEKFRRKNPHTVIEINHGYQEDTNAFDIIIADDEANRTGLDRKLIVSEEIMLAIRKDNPLSEKDTISSNDLVNQQFISMNKESSLYRIAKSICTQSGFEPNVVIHSEDPFYVRKCVELGLGIAFFPGCSWKGQFSKDIIIKSFGEFRRNTFAYWHNKRYLKKSAKELLLLLIAENEV